MEISIKDNNKSGTGSGTGNKAGVGIEMETKEEKEQREENNKVMDQMKNKEEGPKKRGRKKKETAEEDKIHKDQDKFFVDVSRDKDQRQLIQNFLNQANNKSYGREVILKDLILLSLPKLTPKDIERVQENSLSEMERVQRALDEHNKKAESKLTLGEFLVKKLSLQ